MKKARTLITLIVILVLMVTGYILLSVFQDSEEDPAPGQEPVVLFAAQGNIVKLQYEYEGEELKFQLKEGAWGSEKNPGFPLSQTYFTRMADGFAQVTADRLVEENSEDLARYGLESPQCTLTATDDAGNAVTFFIGDLNAVTGGYYCAIQGEGKVYMVKASFPERFFYTLYELAALETMPVIDPSAVSEIEVQKDHGVFLFRHLPEGSPLVYTESYQWFFQGEDNLTPMDAVKLTELLGSLSGLGYLSCADYDADEAALTDYGLDESAVTITVRYTATYEEQKEAEEGEETEPVTKTEDRTITLLLGNTDENGAVYAKTADSKMIGRLDPLVAEPFLEFYPSQYLPLDVCPMLFSEVESMLVRTKEKTYEIRIEREQVEKDGYKYVEVAYFVNGEEVETRAFNAFFNPLVNLRAESALQMDATGEREPVLSVVFKRNVPKFAEMTLELAPFDPSFYLAQFRGEARLLVNKRHVEALLKQLEQWD